jgi:hypothetical protein
MRLGGVSIDIIADLVVVEELVVVTLPGKVNLPVDLASSNNLIAGDLATFIVLEATLEIL